MLRPKQLQLAELMCAEPELTILQLSEKVQCSERSVYNWVKIPEFQEYYHQLCLKRFNGYQAMAIKKLKEQVDSGKWQAIQYLLDNSGFKAADNVNISSDTGIDINVNIGGDANA